jgi:hypothetical protein
MSSDDLERPDAKEYLRVQEAIRRWDPIGVHGPGSDWSDDEYSMYTPTIIRMLDARVTAMELSEHLRSLVVERTELPNDDSKNIAIATELVGSWSDWKDGQQLATG